LLPNFSQPCFSGEKYTVVRLTHLSAKHLAIDATGVERFFKVFGHRADIVVSA
jgi:hypothetical protein